MDTLSLFDEEIHWLPKLLIVTVEWQSSQGFTLWGFILLKEPDVHFGTAFQIAGGVKRDQEHGVILIAVIGMRRSSHVCFKPILRKYNLKCPIFYYLLPTMQKGCFSVTSDLLYANCGKTRFGRGFFPGTIPEHPEQMGTTK
jgi:hypothetical protein